MHTPQPLQPIFSCIECPTFRNPFIFRCITTIMMTIVLLLDGNSDKAAHGHEWSELGNFIWFNVSELQIWNLSQKRHVFLRKSPTCTCWAAIGTIVFSALIRFLTFLLPIRKTDFEIVLLYDKVLKLGMDRISFRRQIPGPISGPHFVN